MGTVLGRRKDFDKYRGEFPPSNLPLAALGAALLWMGWFGFNAGSALTAGPLATSAVASTQIAACASGCVWLGISWYRDKPSSVALINGVIAGLAGITPASGYIDSQASIAIGVLLGVVSYGSVLLFKHKWRIDDALDVSSVHGMTGAVGAICIGLFGQERLNSHGEDGLFYGNPKLFGIQLFAVLVVALYAAIFTVVVALIINKTIGLKISDKEEEIGLDLVEHGEYAYHNLFLPGFEPAYGRVPNIEDADEPDIISETVIRATREKLPLIQHE